MHIYGIKNCDTVKKALKHFEAQGTAFTFHDFKKEIPSAEKLQEWIDNLGAETLINKRGTTFRKLDETTKNMLNNGENIIETMQANTSLIKRPIIEDGDNVSAGFKG